MFMDTKNGRGCMSQKQVKRYKKSIDKAAQRNRTAIVVQFLEWIREQPISYRLRFCWDIIKGSRKDSNGQAGSL